MSDQNRTTTERKRVEIPEAFAVNGSGLPDKVFRLRKRLYIKAKQEPGFRFYTLYDRICRLDVLTAAWTQVARNRGAPGVDGMSIEDVQRSSEGVEGFVARLQKILVERRYRPSAVRRKMIPKANGGERPLGIPTVRDRVVQTAAKLILEPIFEADFLDVSWGYRPGRDAKGAVEAIRQGIASGRKAVIDADLKGYFDSIPHDRLMACVEKRVADRSVLKLIRQWLRAPIHEPPDDPKGPPRKRYPKEGTPQGGVVSALLANVYLHWLDKRFHGPEGPARFANAQLVRYADDFVVMAHYHSNRIRDWLTAIVEDWMGLTIHTEKTREIRLEEPGSAADFVGYRLCYLPDQKGRGHRYLHIGPSPASMARARDRIRELVNRRRSCVPLPIMVGQVNRYLRGWAQYFDYGYPRTASRALNKFVYERLRRHLQHHRSQRAYRPPAGVSYYAHLHQQMGLLKL